ncbi:hypothetical protein [Methanofollis ethanolicus]|uniref:hypothetical protein n=1 Tax=Methanofollis ethanolicus TaxID=488124 RepID=UPI00082F85E2|nr:hypothetical protein [Methanofollis ethanolicus]
MTEKKKAYQRVIFALVLAGVVVCTLIGGCTTVDDTGGDQGVSAAGTPGIPEGATPRNGMPGGPDLASAAATLGVTEEELQEALGTGEGGRIDFEAAASRLGVTVEDLREALGNPQGGGTPPNGTAPDGTPPATPARG